MIRTETKGQAQAGCQRNDVLNANGNLLVAQALLRCGQRPGGVVIHRAMRIIFEKHRSADGIARHKARRKFTGGSIRIIVVPALLGIGQQHG